jgi:spermidine/putrescine-binding protein
LALCKSFLLGFNLWLVVVAYAQDEKLIAEAKKEGKVVVYGSMETNIFDDIQKAFEKKTGVTIEYWRASGATVLDRVISERTTRRPLYDVVINNAGPIEIMLKEGILTNYDFPLMKNFPVETIHPQLGSQLSHQRSRHHLQQDPSFA